MSSIEKPEMLNTQISLQNFQQRLGKIVSLDQVRRKTSGLYSKQPLLKSKTAGAQALSKALTAKFSMQLQQVDRKDPGFREIYEKISNYDITSKLRLENIKVTKK